MGTPQIATTILTSLIRSPYRPYMVITRPDKPKGRDKKNSLPEVKILAQKNKIPILQPQNKLELEQIIVKEKPDLIIVCAFGMIITKKTIDTAKFGAINVHPSLLPKYRGPSPIMAPILNGDAQTGTTIMLMNEHMDEGDILAQKSLPLTGKETTPELTQKLSHLSSSLLLETLPLYLSDQIKPQKQNHSYASYTKILKKEEGKIDWHNMTAEEIERMSRAYIPWPGIYTFWNGKKIDLFEIKVQELSLEPGKVVVHKSDILIGTKKGAILPQKLRVEGKNKISSAEFLRGYPQIKDSILN